MTLFIAERNSGTDISLKIKGSHELGYDADLRNSFGPIMAQQARAREAQIGSG